MFTDPIKNLKALGLKEDAVVADLGAGTGFYSIALGMLIPKGKIYAIEVVKDFLATIKNKVQETHLKNVEIIWGNIEKLGGTQIKDNIVDVAIASNVFSQVEDKSKFIEEIKRILKNKGRVLLVDWSTESSIQGLKMIVDKKKALEMFEKKDFILDREINAGAHHYGMILIKN